MVIDMLPVALAGVTVIVKLILSEGLAGLGDVVSVVVVFCWALKTNETTQRSTAVVIDLMVFDHRATCLISLSARRISGYPTG
jgi:hypothetical protein